jgi:hypothetical protein
MTDITINTIDNDNNTIISIVENAENIISTVENAENKIAQVTKGQQVVEDIEKSLFTDDNDNDDDNIIIVKSDSNIMSELKDIFRALTTDQESRALLLFENVTKIISESFDQFKENITSEDTILMRTTNVANPKNLVQFAAGNENVQQDVIDFLSGMIPPHDSDTYVDTCFNQLLYNCVRGHVGAINKIKTMLGDKFNINHFSEYTFKYNNEYIDEYVNPLKLALLFEHSPEFVKYILSFDSINESFYDNDSNEGNFEETPIYYALESGLLYTNSAQYIEILDIIVSAHAKYRKPLPKEFLGAYFAKKRKMVTKYTALCCKLEEKLLITSIDDYFDQCEHPLLMARLFCNKLKATIKKLEDSKSKHSILSTCNKSKIGVTMCIHSDKNIPDNIVNEPNFTPSTFIFCDDACNGHQVI